METMLGLWSGSAAMSIAYMTSLLVKSIFSGSVSVEIGTPLRTAAWCLLWLTGWSIVMLIVFVVGAIV